MQPNDNNGDDPFAVFSSGKKRGAPTELSANESTRKKVHLDPFVQLE